MIFTLADYIAAVREELAEPSDDFFPQAQIVKRVNEGRREFARKTTAIKTRAEANSIINEPNYPFPIFIQPYNFVRPDRVEFDGKKLEWVDLRDIDRRRGETVTVPGIPDSYTIYENTMIVFPAPDRVKAFRIWYESTTVNLIATTDTDTDIPDSDFATIVFYAVARLKMKDKKFSQAREYRVLNADGVRDAYIRVNNPAPGELVSMRPYSDFVQGYKGVR